MTKSDISGFLLYIFFTSYQINIFPFSSDLFYFSHSPLSPDYARQQRTVASIARFSIAHKTNIRFQISSYCLLSCHGYQMTPSLNSLSF